MALISSTFNFRNLFGGMFRRALNVTDRSSWRNTFLDNKSPVLVDMENLFDVYQSCPHLQAVIGTKAEMLANGILKARNKKDKKEIENHWAVQLISKPNPLQSSKEFLLEYSIYHDIYANNFIYRNAPFPKSKPVTLWNLQSGQMRIVPTGKWLDQTELSGIIEKYQLFGFGMELYKDFTTDEVLHANEGISKSVVLADSKILALQLPVSNIIGALKTRNKFIYYGPKLLLSSKTSDGDGAMPLGDQERKRIEKQFDETDYGLEKQQSHTVITSATLTASKMSYPTKDLMLFEEIEDDFAVICGTYGMKRDIFPSTKGATNENMNTAEKSTYQSTIQPAAESVCKFLGEVLNLDAENVELYLDYSHLAVMQEDKQKASTERKTNAETNAILFDKGIISDTQFAELMNVDLDGQATSKSADSLGKIPLALQQLALARERANTAGDITLSNAIGQAMDTLTARMVQSVISTTNGN